MFTFIEYGRDFLTQHKILVQRNQIWISEIRYCKKIPNMLRLDPPGAKIELKQRESAFTTSKKFQLIFLFFWSLFHFRERTVIKHLFEIWPSHSTISSLVWTVQACLTNQIPIFQRVNIQIGMDRQIGMPQSICSEK